MPAATRTVCPVTVLWALIPTPLGDNVGLSTAVTPRSLQEARHYLFRASYQISVAPLFQLNLLEFAKPLHLIKLPPVFSSNPVQYGD